LSSATTTGERPPGEKGSAAASAIAEDGRLEGAAEAAAEDETADEGRLEVANWDDTMGLRPNL